MNNNINEFIAIKKKILKQFKCDDDFFINPLINCKWSVKTSDEASFLTYWDENDAIKDCVVVRKNGNPLIFKNNNYTLVIAIECIKIAFILNNKNEI